MTQRLAITGAAGAIGRTLREGLRDDVRELRLLDREHLTARTNGERCLRVDLRDYDQVREAVDGVDAVVHLAALPSEAPFPDILDNNIRTTYHVLEAARRGGVHRVVLASSNHATGMYPAGTRISPDDPTRPDSFYGVGKVCDEALGRMYAEKFGLEVAALRIGSFGQRPQSPRELRTWLSPRDCVRLVRRCLEAPELGFAVLYGVSANTRSWWDDPGAARIGYEPVDDAERYADEVGGGELEDPHQGGPFATPEASDLPPPGSA